MLIENGVLKKTDEPDKKRKVKIPETVHTIGKDAFRSNRELEKVIIGDSVHTIEDNAFSAAENLVKVKLPDTLETLGKEAFSQCEKLSGIVIPEGVTTIEESAFRKCKALKKVTLSSRCQKIGKGAFLNCTSLRSITLPDTLKELGEGAFKSCEKLEEVIIPPQILVIPSEAFYCCTGLENITLNEKVMTIRENSFNFCKIKSITIPDSCKFIGFKAFANSGLESITLPDSIEGMENGVFSSCNALTRVVFPKGLKHIPNSICSYCKNLTEVVFPENVMEIGSEAFRNTGLASVVLPSSVSKIGSSAFISCSKLKNIEFTNAITEIKDKTFSHCTALEQINLPNSVKSIGEEAFNDCTSLTSVTLPDSVEKIDRAAFRNCKNLVSVTLPKGLKTIEDMSFNQCDNLKDIFIPESVENIDSFAFSECRGLENITIPKSVRYIGHNAFSDCTSLKSIVLPAGIEEIQNATFKNCTSLERVKIPGSVKKINEGAFTDCKSLKSIVLPDSIEEIQKNAFEGCTSLESIVIPASVTKFEAYPSLAKQFKYITQTENGIVLSNSQNEKSLTLPVSDFNLYFIGRNWDKRNKIISESKNDYVRKFYNEFVSELDDEAESKFISDHNFTFFKQLREFDSENGNYNFFKFLYNIGVFETPKEENGKTVNFGQKITMFLIEKLRKKEISTSALAQIFTNMQENGFKKEFTEFFMTDFDELLAQEKNSPGFISNCYNDFEEIQATNTSNRGKQRQLKPTVRKFADYYDTDKFKGITAETQAIANAISPYFSGQEEFDFAVKVMQEFKDNNTPTRLLSTRLVDKSSPFTKIDEYHEKIEQASGETVASLADVAANEFTFEWLEKNDPTNFYLGKLCSCCAHLSGVGLSIMHASIVDPHVQNLVIRNNKNQIIAKSTLFINPKEGYGVFNNIEIRSNLKVSETESLDSVLQQIYDKFMEAVNLFAEQYNEENPKQKIKQLNIGVGALLDFISHDHKVSKINFETPYEHYGTGNSHYGGNAKVNQFVLWTINDKKLQGKSNGQAEKQ